MQPIVVAHPVVQTSGFRSAVLRQVTGDHAMLLSPTQIAFATTGTTSCVWLPTRLTVLDRSTIEIQMRINGDAVRCGTGAVSFPIAVKIPRSVDVGHPVTLRLAYAVHVSGSRPSTSQRTVVAPALSHVASAP